MSLEVYQPDLIIWPTDVHRVLLQFLKESPRIVARTFCVCQRWYEIKCDENYWDNFYWYGIYRIKSIFKGCGCANSAQCKCISLLSA
jgi:hypothetical protein